jgi:hypothetical protein
LGASQITGNRRAESRFRQFTILESRQETLVAQRSTHFSAATSDELDSGEEVALGLVIAGDDDTKLLDAGKEVLDQMARRIKLSVVVA